MTLSDREIWMELQSGDLTIDPPPDYGSVGPSSVDLHLHTKVHKFKEAPAGVTIRLREVSAQQVIDFATEEVDISDKPIELAPRELMIGYTAETVGLPPHLCARVEGRSGFARLGLSVHNTAPMIQAGWHGRIALELSNGSGYPLQLDSGIAVCQLILERLGRPATPYAGQFQDQELS